MNKIPSDRTVVLDGITYNYRKVNRPTFYNFKAYEKECEEKLSNALSEKPVEIIKGMPRPSYDRFDYYSDLLKWILCSEDMSGLEADQILDWQEAETAIINFVPESMRLSATLIGL